MSSRLRPPIMVSLSPDQLEFRGPSIHGTPATPLFCQRRQMRQHGGVRQRRWVSRLPRSVHIVHNSVRPAYVETMRAIAQQLSVGDPAAAGTVVGPLIREAARSRVERFVQQGQDEGAQLVAGGRRPAHLDKGFFYNVTIFDGVTNDMSVAQEEILRVGRDPQISEASGICGSRSGLVPVL